MHNERIFKNSLAEAIDTLKGFSVKYSTLCDDKLIIEHNHRSFLIDIKEVERDSYKVLKEEIMKNCKNNENE